MKTHLYGMNGMRKYELYKWMLLKCRNSHRIEWAWFFSCRGVGTFGPFVVMIYKMCSSDMVRFFIIFGVFLIQFSQGIRIQVQQRISFWTNCICFSYAQRSNILFMPLVCQYNHRTFISICNDHHSLKVYLFSSLEIRSFLNRNIFIVSTHFALYF